MDNQLPTEQESSEENVRTRQDAGRLGGLKTAQKHGPDFFRKIGRAGGKARGVKKKEPALNHA